MFPGFYKEYGKGKRRREAPAAQLLGGHRDEKLHCHYQIHTDADSARFTLFHTPEDLDALLTEGEALGVTRAVGLYQELHGIPQFLTAPE